MVIESGPAWIPCPDCDEYLCTIHECHACDCDCPSVDEWPVDPYSTGGYQVTIVHSRN